MRQLFILSLILFSSITYAQEVPPNIIIGTEIGIDVHKFEPILSRNAQITAGVTFEYPIGKFSLGSGFLYKTYGSIYSRESNGITSQEVKDEELITYHHFDEQFFELRYYSIPMRIQYRLPCNCVYLQAGIHADITEFGEKTPGDHRFRTTELPEAFHFNRDDALKPLNVTFELAIGFKMHFNDHLRMFMRPTYRYMTAPAKANSVLLNSSYQHFHLAFGIQRALGVNHLNKEIN